MAADGKWTPNQDTRERGSGEMATNERKHERRQCNTTSHREQSPGEGAQGQPGYYLAWDPKLGSPALGAREGAGRRGWQPMANGPMACDVAHFGGAKALCPPPPKTHTLSFTAQCWRACRVLWHHAQTVHKNAVPQHKRGIGTNVKQDPTFQPHPPTCSSTLPAAIVSAPEERPLSGRDTSLQLSLPYYRIAVRLTRHGLGGIAVCTWCLLLIRTLICPLRHAGCQL